MQKNNIMNDLEKIHNQKVVIQSTNQTAPHLETELEIIEILLNQENEVYWLQCKAEFKNCFYNPKNDNFRCKTCYSKVQNAEKTVRQFNVNSNKLYTINYSDFLKNTNYLSVLQNEAFQDVDALKNFEYKGFDLGLATASSLVSFTRNHRPNTINYNDFIKRGLTTGAYIFDAANIMLNEISPDLVIVFNGRFVENRALMRACETSKIDYATHEKGGRISTFLFRKNSIPHSIDSIQQELEYLWENANNDKYEIGKNYFTKKIKGVEDAWYSFTKNQEEGVLPESFKENTNKKIVTIFISSLDEYEGLSGFGPRFYENDNAGIKKIADDLVEYSNIKLYIRVHPNLKGLDNAQMQFINEEIAKISSVELINAEDVVDTYALVKASDIVLVFTTTVGIEAAYMGKKVLLLGRALYEYLNCCIIPKNHEEVIEMITNDNYDFPKVDKDEAIKYGYWNETFGISHVNYVPTGFNKGKYRGKYIKANFITRKMKQIFEKK